MPASSNSRRVVSWSSVLSAAVRSYPGRSGLRALKQRLKLLWKLGRARPQVARWLEGDSNASLRHLVEGDPALLCFCVWPFIHAGWSLEERFDAMLEHRQLVEERFPRLAFGEDERWEILSLAGISPGLRLQLDRSPWFFREGALVLHLFRDDERLMSLAFSLARAQGDLLAYVGAIQGANRPDALEIYRQLTKAQHGMRPRDFVLAAFQLLMGALGVKRALCVADAYRHQQHSYFAERARRELYLSYDEVWREHGGRLLSSGFFELAVPLALRPLDEVPSRKRAMYRRRYLMLAALDRALRDELGVGRLEHPRDGASVHG